ncbi:histamine H2 receptor-like [Patiria miniata]|uniref:G-protein coupled receptors family 1 profile domain-containing protein n=1 Tax=Patiria miniata TaxID=46514 RepID=A0A913YYV6_PATMI|nr:histamine H2 receptor-like [Patiria miniata]
MDNLTTVSPSDVDGEVVVYPSFAYRVVYATIIAIISVVGVIGNTFVILGVIVYKKLRTKTNVFVVNLSGADLFNCLNLPWMSVAVLSVDGWPLPGWICSFASVSLLVSIGSSLYSLGGIALCRCALVTMNPTEYANFLTRRRLACLMAIVWTVPITVSLMPLTFAPNFLGFNDKYDMCIWDTNHWFSMTYNVILSICCFPLPLSVIVVSYARIWRHVRRHAQRMARVSARSVSGVVDGNGARKAPVNRRQMAVTINMLIIICIFLVCITPYSMILVLPGGEIVVPAFGVVLLSNSCINPLIYATRHPDFKLAFAKILRCKGKELMSERSRVQNTQS